MDKRRGKTAETNELKRIEGSRQKAESRKQKAESRNKNVISPQ